MDVPWLAEMALMPNRAISDDVSNPRPKRTPSGYIFHGLRFLSAPVKSDSCSTKNLPINKLEHAFQYTKEASSTFDGELGFGRVSRRIDDLTKLFDEFV